MRVYTVFCVSPYSAHGRMFCTRCLYSDDVLDMDLSLERQTLGLLVGIGVCTSLCLAARQTYNNIIIADI